MAQGGNKDTSARKLRGTRVRQDLDYKVKSDPDIRGVNKGRAESEQYYDSREERDR